MMKTSSHSATTKEDRSLALASESNEAPKVALTTICPQLQAVDAKQENTVVDIARHYFHLFTLTKVPCAYPHSLLSTYSSILQ